MGSCFLVAISDLKNGINQPASMDLRAIQTIVSFAALLHIGRLFGRLQRRKSIWNICIKLPALKARHSIDKHSDLFPQVPIAFRARKRLSEKQ
jgi:hypothetical protein